MFIAVCDDEKVSRDFEKQIIQKWAEKEKVDVSVDLYTSAENFLFESEDKIEYDLLILDIQMGKMNGVELARTLRKRGFSGQLIFLTGVKDYAIEGYEVGAVRYLLKPIKEDAFVKVLNFVYNDFQKKDKDFYLLKIGTDITKILFEKIIYVEARGHYVHLLCVDFEKEWKAVFGSVSDEFQEHGFFCLRRGLLVNLLHISKITRTECFMDNGEILPVARNNYQELNEAFIKFYRMKEIKELEM